MPQTGYGSGLVRWAAVCAVAVAASVSLTGCLEGNDAIEVKIVGLQNGQYQVGTGFSGPILKDMCMLRFTVNNKTDKKLKRLIVIAGQHAYGTINISAGNIVGKSGPVDRQEQLNNQTCSSVQISKKPQLKECVFDQTDCRELVRISSK